MSLVLFFLGSSWLVLFVVLFVLGPWVVGNLYFLTVDVFVDFDLSMIGSCVCMGLECCVCFGLCEFLLLRFFEVVLGLFVLVMLMFSVVLNFVAVLSCVWGLRERFFKLLREYVFSCVLLVRLGSWSYVYAVLTCHLCVVRCQVHIELVCVLLLPWIIFARFTLWFFIKSVCHCVCTKLDFIKVVLSGCTS